MVRANEKPVQWRMLLDAMNKGDDDGAKLICRMSGFDANKAKKIKKSTIKFGLFSYHYKSPAGESGVVDTAREMVERMGVAPHVISYQFKKIGLEGEEGKINHKGWEVRRVKRDYSRPRL